MAEHDDDFSTFNTYLFTQAIDCHHEHHIVQPYDNKLHMACMAEKMQGPSPDYYLAKSDDAISCLYHFRSELDDADTVQSKRGILLSGTQKGSLYTWNLRTRRPTSVIPAHSSAILSLTVTNDDELISQGRDGLIHRWKADAKDTWTKLQSIPYMDLTFCPITCFKMNNHLLIAVPSKTQSCIEIWDLNLQVPIMVLEPPDDKKSIGLVMDFKVIACADQSHIDLIACYEDGSMFLWDVKAGGMVRAQNNFHQEPVTSFDLCTRTKKGLSGSVDNKVILWKYDVQGTLKQLRLEEMPNPGVACVRARPDGKLFAVGCWDSAVRLYGGLKLTPLVTLWAHEQTIQSLSFDVDNSFAAGSKDGNISVWSLYKDK